MPTSWRSASCGRGAVSATCPDCQTRFKVFYTGDPNGDIRQGANGIVTSECLKSNCCWFHIGCKKCVPKHCSLHRRRRVLRLLRVGHARRAGPIDEAHAWPSWTTRCTTRRSKRTKEVVYYIDEYGLPTTHQRSVGKVTANVAIDERAGEPAEDRSGRRGPHRTVPRLSPQARQGAAGGHHQSRGSAKRCWTKTRCSKASWTSCTSNCAPAV